MIKPVKGLSPITIYYFDNGDASIFNLSKQQFEVIYESEDDPWDTLDRFKVEDVGYEVGYAPSLISTLSEIYDFGVDSI